MGQLQDKVAIVTGAARGLGRAYAQAMAREGAAVLVCDVNSCDETVAAIAAAGGQVKGVRDGCLQHGQLHGDGASGGQRLRQGRRAGQ